MDVVRLRGHHLLCLLGYRGKGYSEPFCANMTSIYEQLRTKPETLIEIIEGPDDICKDFPQDQNPHCENETVYRKDSEIVELVGISCGKVTSWSDICSRIAGNVEPDDIARLCRDCRWEPLGLCRQGVGLVKAGCALPSVGPGQQA